MKFSEKKFWWIFLKTKKKQKKFNKKFSNFFLEKISHSVHKNLLYFSKMNSAQLKISLFLHFPSRNFKTSWKRLHQRAIKNSKSIKPPTFPTFNKFLSILTKPAKSSPISQNTTLVPPNPPFPTSYFPRWNKSLHQNNKNNSKILQISTPLTRRSSKEPISTPNIPLFTSNF